MREREREREREIVLGKRGQTGKWKCSERGNKKEMDREEEDGERGRERERDRERERPMVDARPSLSSHIRDTKTKLRTDLRDSESLRIISMG